MLVTYNIIILLMAQLCSLFFLLCLFFLFISGVYCRANITVMNNCSYTVWPAISDRGRFARGSTQIPDSQTGFVLQKGESKSILAPNSWSGSFWGRTYCSKNSTGYFYCITGDCGTGKLECSADYYSPPTTTAGLSINSGGSSVDIYRINLIGGYNLPIAIAPQSGTHCTNTECKFDLNGECPDELQVLSSVGNVVACNNEYSEGLKNACPTATYYRYPYNDNNVADAKTMTFTCATGTDYIVTFCPSADSSIVAGNGRHPSGNGKLPAVAIVAIVVGIIFSIILFTVCFLRRKAKKNHNLTTEATEVDSLKYDLSYIKAATNNFSAENKIGEGGFGEVFKGTLNSGEVAVKRLSKSSGQGEQEFKNEVLVVAKLQHRNLVRLLGYCVEKEEKILIYEYVPNESLDFILFDAKKKQSLDWSRRYKIIGGVARGILYLHVDSRLRIIHRDIKASNVLLDSDMNAKISDFGLARIVGFDESQGNTKRVVGTFGYMSPEYITHGQFSVKSDVFSFGVLVLEIISGTKNNRFYQSSEHLLSYAWKLWSDTKALDLVDPAVGDSYNESEVSRCIHMALLCVQEDVDDRPTMASVVLMLSSTSMTLPIPHEPAFFLQGAKMPESSLPDTEISSANELSISEFYPR